MPLENETQKEDMSFLSDQEVEQELNDFWEKAISEYENDYQGADNLSLYLHSIKNFNVLTKEEERFYFQKFKEGDKTALKKLVECNLKLVVSAAKKYNSALSSSAVAIDFLDLIQEGNLGILRALDTFDLERDLKFSTYAYWWISQRIERFIMNYGKTIRVPVHREESIRALKKIMQTKENELGRNLTENEKYSILQEYAEAKNIDFYLLLSFFENIPISLNSFIRTDEDDNTELGDFIPNSNDRPDIEAENNVLREELIQLLKESLNTKEFYIICKRFGFYDGEIYTLEQLGKEFGLTRERIRQIEARAIKKLRNKRRYFEFYLNA